MGEYSLIYSLRIRLSLQITPTHSRIRDLFVVHTNSARRALDDCPRSWFGAAILLLANCRMKRSKIGSPVLDVGADNDAGLSGPNIAAGRPKGDDCQLNPSCWLLRAKRAMESVEPCVQSLVYGKLRFGWIE